MCDLHGSLAHRILFPVFILFPRLPSRVSSLYSLPLPLQDNAIPITSWFNDKNDRQLYELLPFLDSMLHVDDVSHVLQRSKPRYGSGIGVPANLMPPTQAGQ